MFYATLQNLIKIPFIFLGLFILPAMWFFRDRQVEDMPKVFLPWTNPEDWTGGYRNFKPEQNCVPDDIYGKRAGFWLFWRYHALRNGGDGLRNFDWHICKYVEGEMELLREDEKGYRIQQGKYGSIGRKVRLFGSNFFIKYGFRQTPEDVRKGRQRRSFRWNFGAGPAWSFRKID